LLFSLVPALMALSGQDRRGPVGAVLEILRRIATNPLMVASAFGFLSAAMNFQPPIALDRLLQFLQGASAPCALFALGVTVAMESSERMAREVPFLVAIKLVLHPAIVLTMMILLGPFQDLWVYTAVLMAALPPALNVFVFASQYDVWVPQASSSILLGTVASVITLTAVMWFVKINSLPLGLP
jgi:malonate transporter and related proteins